MFDAGVSHSSLRARAVLVLVEVAVGGESGCSHRRGPFLAVASTKGYRFARTPDHHPE